MILLKILNIVQLCLQSTVLCCDRKYPEKKALFCDNNTHTTSSVVAKHHQHMQQNTKKNIQAANGFLARPEHRYLHTS